MITGNAAKNQTKNSSSLTSSVWQRALASAVRDPFELIRLLDLEGQGAEVSLEAARQFRLLAPHSYVRRMQKGDWNDPLLRQVLPLSAEMQLTQGFLSDPVGDHAAMVTDGVLHKYQGRVLLVTTGACAIHCRYCFRRHFPYSEANPARDHWQEALDYVASNADISEVLLSGGDPLTLSDDRLSSLCERLAAIEHVQRLRFHTRLPIVLPERIDERLLTWLSRLNKQVIMVIHANHANEFQDAEVQAGLKALREVGVLLLNQSVLLRGVNDSVPALAALSEALVAANVIPYYLHILDRVQGAAHFEVPELEAKALVAALRLTVPGYMVPQLVREVAGEGAKTPL
ncbi:MAG: EF-P beta-lysylation protein EpmB [Thiothrix sp.]|nr:MAG: EF-P beta-lysylation protein EpmB [Thiothrix sp.]